MPDLKDGPRWRLAYNLKVNVVPAVPDAIDYAMRHNYIVVAAGEVAAGARDYNRHY